MTPRQLDKYSDLKRLYKNDIRIFNKPSNQREVTQNILNMEEIEVAKTISKDFTTKKICPSMTFFFYN